MKYMGSKSRLAKFIVPIIQRMIDENGIGTYIEPFVGGANMIDKIKCSNKIGYDKSKELIALLNHAKASCDYPEDIPKDLYDKVRTSFNKNDDTYTDLEKGIAGFLASCKGRFFDGGYSGTRTGKNGITRNYYDEAKRNLIKQSPNLKDTTFIHIGTYSNIEIPNGSLVYCDPPYKDTKQYGTSKGFNHDDFWQWVRDISANNIVLVSELQSPDDFEEIWSQELKIAMNNDTSKTNTEKLFVHKSILHRIAS
ncbi:MAG: DNA adenine methylase [Peptostreptococcaceae bacterium]